MNIIGLYRLGTPLRIEGKRYPVWLLHLVNRRNNGVVRGALAVMAYAYLCVMPAKEAVAPVKKDKAPDQAGLKEK